MVLEHVLSYVPFIPSILAAEVVSKVNATQIIPLLLHRSMLVSLLFFFGRLPFAMRVNMTTLPSTNDGLFCAIVESTVYQRSHGTLRSRPQIQQYGEQWFVKVVLWCCSCLCCLPIDPFGAHSTSPFRLLFAPVFFSTHKYVIVPIRIRH